MTKGDEINITDFKQLKGLGPESEKKLRNNGDYITITEVATAIPEELGVKCKMSPDMARKAVDQANEFLRNKGFLGSNIRTALDDLQRRESLFKIPTGSVALDGLLHGGIEEGSITEFFGLNGGGKTQICHTVALNATLPVDKGGIDGNVLYIDTEGAFRPNRLRQMCMALELNPEEVLGRITVTSMQYKADLLKAVDNLPKFVEENKIKLIVVDSIIALFRGEYGGMGELASRQQSLGSVMHKLSRIIDVYHPAIVITNQMQDNPTIYGPSKVPTGGNTLGHASTYRIQLGTLKGYRTATIYKSPESGNDKISFHIDQRGVIDVPPTKTEQESNSEQ